MFKNLVVLFGMTLLPLSAAEPVGFVYWQGGRPPAEGPKSPKLDNHVLMSSHRDKSGVGEVHETQADVMVIQSGEATLTVGGELVSPKTIRPGELQGSSVKGGITQTISAGDIINIPAGMPHQMTLQPGKEISYLVVKVDKK